MQKRIIAVLLGFLIGVTSISEVTLASEVDVHEQTEQNSDNENISAEENPDTKLMDESGITDDTDEKNHPQLSDMEDKTEDTSIKETDVQEIQPQSIEDTVVYLNPIYTFDENDLREPADSEVTASVQCNNAEDAETYLRDQLRQHVQDICFKYPKSDFEESQIAEIFAKSVKHTENGTEGDYIRFQYAGWKATYEEISDDESNWMIYYAVTYFTTVEQERELSSWISDFLNKLDFAGKNDYQKIRSLYDSIYKIEHSVQEDTDSRLKYTAYGAMNRSAESHGYASLLYRLLMELGFDARIVEGTEGENTQSHAWNIVKIGDVYYYLDACCDAEQDEEAPYSYFLIGKSSLAEKNHYVKSGDPTESYTVSEADAVAPSDTDPAESDFEYIIENDEAYLTSYKGEEINLAVPSSLGGYPLKGICAAAFDYNYFLESITFSEGLAEIEPGSIRDCAALKTIYLPSTLKISADITGRGGIIFGCENLEEIYITGNSESLCVEDGVLYTKDKKALLLYPPAKKDEIFNLPSGVTTISSDACRDNKYLKQVTMPDTVTSIGYWAFANDEMLETVSLSENCEFIGQYALQNTSVTELNIPAKVISIAPSAFYNNQQLQKITVSDGNTVYHSHEGVLCTQTSVVSYPPARTADAYEIEPGITTIEESAFYRTRTLKKLTFSDTVASIKKAAFQECRNLAEINLPTSLASVENYAFYYCDGLMNISYSGDERQWSQVRIGEGNEYLVPDIEHMWNEGEVLQEPDCVKAGIKKYVCTVCGKEKEESIDALGHDFSKEFVIDKEATGTQTGSKSRHCSRCDEKTDITVIPMITFTVIFDSNGGSSVGTQKVSKDTKVVKPGDPTRAGYTFKGWYLDGQLYDFSQIVTKDLKLTAEWEKAEPDAPVFKVTFDSAGGSAVPSQTIIDGGKVTQPSAPIRAGYDFTGWYEDEECERLWNFNTDTVKSNLTLYAGWEENGEYDQILPEDMPYKKDALWVAPVHTKYTYSGKAIKPSVHVYYDESRLEEGVDYTVRYRNNTKAYTGSASENKAPTITIKGKGIYKGSAKTTFQILPADFSSNKNIVARDITVPYKQKGVKVIPTVSYKGKKLSSKKDFTHDGGIYTEEGTYKISIKGVGNFTGQKEIEVVVSKKNLITKAAVKKIKSVKYTGQEIKPELIVSFKKKPLVNGTDYTVEYENNIEIGTATAIIRGMGEYAGIKYVTFKITGESLKKATVGKIDAQFYTGTLQKPKVTLNGGMLKENVDYKVSYSNNKNAGKATVTIEGLHSYTGILKKTFKIRPYELKAGDTQLGGLDGITGTYVDGVSKPEPKLTFKGKTLINGKDYKLSYQNNKSSSAKQSMIIIKGKGNFKGTLKLPFSIIEK